MIVMFEKTEKLFKITDISIIILGIYYFPVFLCMLFSAMDLYMLLYYKSPVSIINKSEYAIKYIVFMSVINAVRVLANFFMKSKALSKNLIIMIVTWELLIAVLLANAV